MPDGRLNNRFADLEKTIARIELKIDHLESAINATREEHETRVDPQQTSAQEDSTAHCQPAPYPKTLSTPENPTQAKKPWYKSTVGWKTLFELIGIPFAVGYAVVTFLQWRDLRQNFEVEQRAWIKVSSDIYDSDDIPAHSTRLTVENIGKSPALGESGTAVFQIIDSKSEPSVGMFPQGHSESVFPPLMFPNDNNSFEAVYLPRKGRTERDLSETEIDALKSGDAYVAVYGAISYRDQFGTHFTTFCGWRSYSQEGKGNFNALKCTQWNVVGEGPLPVSALAEGP